MRWSSLRSPDPAAGDGDGMLPLALPSAMVRTFAAPEFAGVTFYEIAARSLISRVPAASRMPFEWTINPYRGCSHACTYCLAGDTRVLLAGGATAPIESLRVGDQVVGTAGQPGRRRMVTATVLDHWSITRPGFRVVLDDGTELVASREHRLLSGRGWVHVATGHPGRPALRAGDRLVGPSGTAWREGHLVDGLVGVESVEPTGTELPMFDITTTTGNFIAAGVLNHNCFARDTHTYLDLDSGHDFDTKIIVKVNAPELLRRELRAPRWAGQPIAMGTNVDCYQRAEGRYRLMRGILEALRDYANPFSILTKGTLITRDLDLLSQAAEVTRVSLSLSVGSVDPAIWRTAEPGTPSPGRRLDALRRLSDAGFAVGVLMAPVLPGLTDTDESIDATVAAIAAAGAAGVTPIALHLRPGARQWYWSWLARTYPDLERHYRQMYGPGAYAPADYQRGLTARVAAAARRHGLRYGAPPEHPYAKPAPAPGQAGGRVAVGAPAAVQLTLL